MRRAQEGNVGAAALKLLGTTRRRREKGERTSTKSYEEGDGESSTLFLHTTAKSIKVVVVCSHISCLREL